MSHQMINKTYTVKGKSLILVEFDGKVWATWSSLRDVAGFPEAVSLPVVESTLSGGLGSGAIKTKAPKLDGNFCQCWILSFELIQKILIVRFDDEAMPLIDEIGDCFVMFKSENDLELSDSGGSETEDPGQTISPQDDIQEQVDDSPEQEGFLPETLKQVCDRFDESMDAMAKVMTEALGKLNDRVDDLEMVKYAGQLGDMAERVSNFEEKLYSYEAELRDFKLVVRSLKEATGSQVQAETISKLVDMVKINHVQS